MIILKDLLIILGKRYNIIMIDFDHLKYKKYHYLNGDELKAIPYGGSKYERK